MHVINQYVSNVKQDVVLAFYYSIVLEGIKTCGLVDNGMIYENFS